jgi:hypothetical protein
MTSHLSRVEKIISNCLNTNFVTPQILKVAPNACLACQYYGNKQGCNVATSPIHLKVKACKEIPELCTEPATHLPIGLGLMLAYSLACFF